MRSIHHVLEMDVSPEVLWAALTERDQLAGWWSTQVESPAAAAGVRIAFTFFGDFNPVMEITIFDAPNQLAWRCVAGHDNWQDGDFRFELVDLGGGRTKLRFWQDYTVEVTEDQYGVYNFSWGYYLESLRMLCQTGTGKPFEVPG